MTNLPTNGCIFFSLWSEIRVLDKWNVLSGGGRRLNDNRSLKLFKFTLRQTRQTVLKATATHPVFVETIQGQLQMWTSWWCCRWSLEITKDSWITQLETWHFYEILMSPNLVEITGTAIHRHAASKAQNHWNVIIKLVFSSGSVTLSSRVPCRSRRTGLNIYRDTLWTLVSLTLG